MTRRHLTFSCEGDTLCATLDEAPGDTGLLLVSGGNEIRSGAWSGQAGLAARIAATGRPVFRYDRRGIGDSEGANTGFRGAAADLAAALSAFRLEVPRLRRVVAFGNCDGATTLALFGSKLPLDGLVLANPWVIDGDEAPDALPPSALRSRYAGKLRDPREWRRLLGGGVDLAKLARGLRQLMFPAPPAPSLAKRMEDEIGRYRGPVRILLAEGDRTAQLFLDQWTAVDDRIRGIESRSHSFSDEAAREWLFGQVCAALED